MHVTNDISIGAIIQLVVMIAGFIVMYTKLVQRIAIWETKLEIMWAAFSRRWTGNSQHDENMFDGHEKIDNLHRPSHQHHETT